MSKNLSDLIASLAEAEAKRAAFVFDIEQLLAKHGEQRTEGDHFSLNVRVQVLETVFNRAIQQLADQIHKATRG